MDYQNDFLTQYKAINNKLKKRFLRKPNVSEASEKFGLLAKELENKECPHYAAFCCLAVARCEHSVGNSTFESQNLLHAARLFLESERLSHELQCPSHNEHLQSALHSFRECIKVYIDSDQPALAAALCLEVGQALRNLGRISESIAYFKQAAKLHKNCPIDYINDLKEISACYLSLGDYHGALNSLTDIQVIAEKKCFKESGERIGAFAKILNETEVTRVLLLLLLEPPAYKLNPEHSKLLERYSDVDSEPVDYIDEDLFLLLQSFMIAINEKNENAMFNLEIDIGPHLNTSQADILNSIIAKNRNVLIIPINENPGIGIMDDYYESETEESSGLAEEPSQTAQEPSEGTEEPSETAEESSEAAEEPNQAS